MSYSKASEEQHTGQFKDPLNVPVNIYRWDPHSVPKPQVTGYSSKVRQNGTNWRLWNERIDLLSLLRWLQAQGVGGSDKTAS